MSEVLAFVTGVTCGGALTTWVLAARVILGATGPKADQ